MGDGMAEARRACAVSAPDSSQPAHSSPDANHSERDMPNGIDDRIKDVSRAVSPRGPEHDHMGRVQFLDTLYDPLAPFNLVAIGPPAQQDLMQNRSIPHAGRSAQRRASGTAEEGNATQDFSAEQRFPAREQHLTYMPTPNPPPARVWQMQQVIATQSNGAMPQPVMSKGRTMLESQQRGGAPGSHNESRDTAQVPGVCRASHVPCASVAVNGRAQQILDHPEAGNAARTKSDGSAHLPGSAHGPIRQILQPCLVQDNRQQSKCLGVATENIPADAESLDMSGRCEEVSRSEKSLIKRLQLYAWVAGDQGRQILQQAFRSIAAKHAAKRGATDGNAGAPQSKLAREEPQASGGSQQMPASNQEVRPEKDPCPDCQTARAESARPLHSDSPRGVRPPTGSRAAVLTASQNLERPASSLDADPGQKPEDAVANDPSNVGRSRAENSGADHSNGRKQEFYPSRHETDTPRSVIPRVNSAQCATNNPDGARVENRSILQPAAAASDVDLDSYLSFGDDSGMPDWKLSQGSEGLGYPTSTASDKHKHPDLDIFAG